MPQFMGLQVENGVMVARIRSVRNHTFVWTPAGFEKKANHKIDLYDEAALHAHGIEMDDLQLLGFQDERGVELQSWITTPVAEPGRIQPGLAAPVAAFN